MPRIRSVSLSARVSAGCFLGGTSPERGSRCRVRFAVAVLAAVVLAAGAEPGRAQEPQQNENLVRVVPDQLHQLDVVAAEPYAFRRQKAAIGQIAYNEDATTPVVTPFPGRVTRLIAKVGDAVKRGDPLLEIDSREVVQPQSEFIAAVAAVNKARSQLDLARTVEKRQKDLYGGDAIALKEWQQAQAGLVSAENDMRAAATSLDAARHRLLIIGRTHGEIDALQREGAISRIATIRAPIDGTVIARKVGPGQYVRSDPPDPLYAIADVSTMWLKAHVPEIDIPLVQIGQKVEVKVTALPGRVFAARIIAIGAASDVATHRVVVRSEIPNPDRALKAEMFASFRIMTGRAETSPSVPSDAVIREGALAVIWVERQPMVFERRPVKIGMEQAGRIQIAEGVTVGERVVARGAIFVDNEWHQ